MTSEYVVFILSNRRPDRVYTYKTLRAHGYTGPIKLVIDDEDPTILDYKSIYGDDVIVFNKRRYVNSVDSFSPDKKGNAVVYARNANFDIAIDLGVEYFIQLDDDYTYFDFRVDGDGRYGTSPILNLDKLISIMFEFFISANIDCLAIAQGGDYIGGSGNKAALKVKRKIMNFFFFCASKRVEFVGKLNEDLSTSVLFGSCGSKFITCPLVSLTQKTTQAQSGGLTELYLGLGTYVKSFYSVMCSPSSVQVSSFGDTHDRIHHRVSWKHAVPKIISEDWRNGRPD